MGHETMGEVVEVGSRQQEAQGRRPRRRPVHDRLRRMLFLQAGLLLRLREDQPERRKSRKALGSLARRVVRLFPSARRVCRRPGRISARAFRRCRPGKSSGRAHRRAGAVSFGHLPDRLYGARNSATSSQATRSRSGAAARSGRWRSAVAFLLGAERVIAIDTVPERMALAREAGAQTLDFMRRGHLRPYPGADARARRGCLHRRGRHRG